MPKEPRFNGTVSKQSHKTMSRIKGKDTRPEIVLRKALWHKGIRYRKNYKGLPGRPDIVLTRYKIAIFVDSEFFHGKDWDAKKGNVSSGANGDYWTAKIERNMARDKEKEHALRTLDYIVIRFWSRDVLGDTEACVHAVQEAIFAKRIGGIADGEIELDERTALLSGKSKEI